MSERDDALDEFGIGGAERVDEGTSNARNAFQQALAAKLARRAPIVQPAQPGKKRRWTVGFGPTGIPPFSTENVQSQSRCLFESETIVVTGDVDDLVVEFFVGTRVQLPRPLLLSTIPLDSNGTRVFNPEFKFDVCNPALTMTFRVKNTGPTTRTFSLAVIGAATL